MLKKAYYTLESSLDSAIAKDVSLDFADMSESEIFRNVILPYFNVTIVALIGQAMLGLCEKTPDDLSSSSSSSSSGGLSSSGGSVAFYPV